MTDIVYVCFASTGEYSDRTEFTLHCYRTEQEAKDFVIRSSQIFREKWQSVKDEDYNKRLRLFQPGWHPDCPNLNAPDYTGYSFWYDPVEVKQ